MERPTFLGEEPSVWIKNKIFLMALIAQVRSLMAISNQLLLYEMLGTLLADFLLNPTRIRCRYCNHQGIITVGNTLK